MRIIAGEAGGRIIRTPDGRDTRPTLDRVRENIFNMIQADVPDSRVLDLFAGSGALSLEALSRGAREAVLNDHDRKASQVERRNIDLLGYSDRTTVYSMNWQAALRELSREGRRFDLVFLDPPYAMRGLPEVFSGLESLLAPGALVILEHRSGERLSVSEAYSCIREREWGYCGVSIYRLTTSSGTGKENES